MSYPGQPEGAERRPAGSWHAGAGVAYGAQHQQRIGNYGPQMSVEFCGNDGREGAAVGAGAGVGGTAAVGVVSGGGGTYVRSSAPASVHPISFSHHQPDSPLRSPPDSSNDKQQNQPSPATVVTNSTTSKSRTSCKFCTQRKKRCDYVEVDNKKQPCTLCRTRGQECVFEQRPARKTNQNNQMVPAPKKNGAGAGAGKLQLKRARMGASTATGLVGMEENHYVADFFDRLGFFPMANERSVQRAIMDLLFQPARQASDNARRRHSDTAAGRGGTEKKRLSGDSMGSILNVGTSYDRDEAEDADSVFGGPLALRRKFYNTTDASGAFSCMLWCTIALGAMTSNMGSRLVNSYVKFAEEAIDGLSNPDVDTAKAYAILGMVHAWLDNERLFSKYLYIAKEMVETMEQNGEEVPLELRDMIKEQERVLYLHYTEDFDRIRECCDDTPEKPINMDPFTMCETGLFHMVRYYSDGVFKAFWRDVLKRDPVLTETKLFAEKHLPECMVIEKIAETRRGLKNTGGALYVRAAMQFIRLPLKTDPEASLKSSIELTKVIAQVPGMIRFGPVKHYVHCLLMGLARPAVAGKDEEAYEKLRGMYNSLDISGPPVAPPEEMDIAKLCKQPFCRGMAWAHQQKLLRLKAELAAKAEKDAADAAAAAAATNNTGGGAAASAPGSAGASAGAFFQQQNAAAGGMGASPMYAQPAPSSGDGAGVHYSPQRGSKRAPYDGVNHHGQQQQQQQQHASSMFSMKQEGINSYSPQQQRPGGMGFPPEMLLPSPHSGRPLSYISPSSTSSPGQHHQEHYAAPSPGSDSGNMAGANAWGYPSAAGGGAAGGMGLGTSPSVASGAASAAMSPGGSSVNSRSSNAAVEAAAAEAYARQRAVLPDDVYAEAQRRSENVQSIDELLLNDEDRRDVPELYQGESDTDDMSFLSMNNHSGGASSSGEEEDEGIRFLAASLLQ